MWESVTRDLDVSLVRARYHRYTVDLNRFLDQVDSTSVQGSPLPPETHPKGLIWYRATDGHSLGPDGVFSPLSQESFGLLAKEIYIPYHRALEEELARVKTKHGFAILIDGHSMPSRGSVLHADSGALRADLVPSDRDGQTCKPALMKLFCERAASHGFSVRPNDPYKGGGITQRFGRPLDKIYSLQIEVNRALYMDEQNFELKASGLERLQALARDFLSAIPLVD